jgi:hypothetical protein
MEPARVEGMEAYHRGDSLEDDNPFDQEDAQYVEWYEGWNEAADESGGDQ